MKLRAPFPWFGGKSLAAPVIWERFGEPANYIEPFAGSLAVLLGRPSKPKTETVNDADCYLANFWRALAADPEAVATAADWPVNEADLHARHKWLRDQVEFRERMLTEPEFYDAKIAGWWVWGLCAWIGRGWCDWSRAFQLPHLGNRGRGVHRPEISLLAEFRDVAERLRRVRVCCGDWARVLGPGGTTTSFSLTAVLLDPPYSGEDDRIYSVNDETTADAVRQWAIENGDDNRLRIALCCFDGLDMPSNWECVAWKSRGGYDADNMNRFRERIYFSPHCLRPATLFDWGEEDRKALVEEVGF